MAEIDLLKGVVMAAGARIMDYYAAGATAAVLKADRTPLTEADKAADACIREGLEKNFPGIPIISEEAPIPPYEKRKEWKRFWLVDPLDGTKEFLKRNGEFTVNAALIEDGSPVLGVVYAPAFGTAYFAAKKGGSWKQDGPGTDPYRITSRFPDPEGPLVVAESRSHPSAELEEFLNGYRVKARVAAGSSLKFCLLAEGKADIYPRFGPTMEWDVAAGDCIYRCSSAGPPHPTGFRYNKSSLKNGPFAVGLKPGTLQLFLPAVVWFTGLSGSGKSTIAERVFRAVKEQGFKAEYLDGDAIRRNFPETGFTKKDRDMHIRRAGRMASRLEKKGVFVVASFVSPYEEPRNFVRGLCENFIEVYVSTPLSVCEKRDAKGLYRRARAGEIKNFTGIDDPYEPPKKPEMELDTSRIAEDDAVDAVMKALEKLKFKTRSPSE